MLAGKHTEQRHFLIQNGCFSSSSPLSSGWTIQRRHHCHEDFSRSPKSTLLRKPSSSKTSKVPTNPWCVWKELYGDPPSTPNEFSPLFFHTRNAPKWISNISCCIVLFFSHILVYVRWHYQNNNSQRSPESPGEMSFHSGTEGILEELPLQTKEAVECTQRRFVWKCSAINGDLRCMCIVTIVLVNIYVCNIS